MEEDDTSFGYRNDHNEAEKLEKLCGVEFLEFLLTSLIITL